MKSIHPDLVELFLTCPYCWERISVLVDPLAGSQDVIEDCEVCCRPLLLRCQVDDDGEVRVDVERDS